MATISKVKNAKVDLLTKFENVYTSLETKLQENAQDGQNSFIISRGGGLNWDLDKHYQITLGDFNSEIFTSRKGDLVGKITISVENTLGETYQMTITDKNDLEGLKKGDEVFVSVHMGKEDTNGNAYPEMKFINEVDEDLLVA